MVDIEDYEKDRAEKKLLTKLHEAEEAVADDPANAKTNRINSLLYRAIIIVMNSETD